jgi:hypothetical protein
VIFGEVFFAVARKLHVRELDTALGAVRARLAH